jgi:hypothetical protein
MFKDDYNDSALLFGTPQKGWARKPLTISTQLHFLALLAVPVPTLYLKCGFCGFLPFFHMRNSNLSRTLSIAIISIYSFPISLSRCAFDQGTAGRGRGERQAREIVALCQARDGIASRDDLRASIFLSYSYMHSIIEYPLICIFCKRNL